MEAALEAAGKTADDLEYDVSRRQRRNDLLAKKRDGEDAVSEQQFIQEKKAEAEMVLREARATYDATCAPLNFRLRELAEIVTTGHQAKQELQQSCDDEGLLLITADQRRSSTATAAIWSRRFAG